MVIVQNCFYSSKNLLQECEADKYLLQKINFCLAFKVCSRHMITIFFKKNLGHSNGNNI